MYVCMYVITNIGIFTLDKSDFKNLKVLILKSKTVKDRGVQFLVKSKLYANIECLDLDMNVLSGKSITAIIEYENSKKLKHLYLIWCKAGGGRGIKGLR